jgi:hypothetical protein
LSSSNKCRKIFRMGDLGWLSYYLGIEVAQEGDQITLCQKRYAEKVVELAGLSNCNSCRTPMECRLKLKKEDGSGEVDKTLYRSVIGSLRYLVNTRPDIAAAVGVANRFIENPTASHWALIKQICRYVQGTLSYGCRYKRGKGEPVLLGYSDSDHAGDLDDRKSTSGVVFFLGSNTVTWSSQKQKVVAQSSCEAEYIAAGAAACQGVWLSRLLGELTGQAPSKFQLLVDNQSALALVKNPVHHDHTKHIDIKYHYIRSCYEDGMLDVDHVRTEEQLADILTKALGFVRFIELRRLLGVVEVQV